MDCREIATVLYGMAIGNKPVPMSAKEDEIGLLKDEIQDLKDNDCILYLVLKDIAEKAA